jgi:glutaredoxin-like protein NrdH
MIKLFTKPGCQGCRQSKKFLERRGVAFQTVDVTEQPDAVDQIRDMGYASLPVLVTDQGHWSGFQPDRLAQLVPAVA